MCCLHYDGCFLEDYLIFVELFVSWSTIWNHLVSFPLLCYWKLDNPLILVIDNVKSVMIYLFFKLCARQRRFNQNQLHEKVWAIKDFTITFISSLSALLVSYYSVTWLYITKILDFLSFCVFMPCRNWWMETNTILLA
jgi:hypothetical protein